MKLTPSQAAAAHLAAALLLLLPIALSQTPPLVDYPKWVSMVHVATVSSNEATANPNFIVAFGWQPYLGLDLWLYPLMRVLPPLLAARVYLGLLVVLTAWSAAILHRTVYGDWYAWPLFAYLLAYHHMVYWGFLNYLSGVPAVLITLAIWYRMRHRSHLEVAAAMSVAAFAVMTLHLLAWGALGLLLLGHTAELLKKRDWTGASWQAVPFLVSGALGVVMPRPPRPSTFSEGRGEFIEWGSLGEFLRGLLAPVNFDYLPSDGMVAITMGMLAYWGLRDRGVRIAPAFTWPMGALAIGLFVVPHTIYALWTTMRLPVVISLLFVAVSQPRVPDSRALRILAAAAAISFVARTGELTVRWRACDALIAEIRAAANLVPVGGTLVTVLSDDSHPQCMQRPMLSHVTAYAAMDRKAYSPGLKVYTTVMPRDEVTASLPDPFYPANLDEPLAVDLIRQRADILVYLHVHDTKPPTPAWLEAIHSTENVTAYRVIPPS